MILNKRPLALFAATAIAAALAVTATYAQQSAPAPSAPVQPPGAAAAPPQGNDAVSRADQRLAQRAEERARMMDRNLAQMKAALQLKPEQEALWAPVEAAMRDMQRTSTEARERMRSESQMQDPAARIRAMAAMAGARAAGLTRVADALDPLYRTFDDGQKRRFAQAQRTGGWGPGGGRNVPDGDHWRGRDDGRHGPGGYGWQDRYGDGDGYGRRWRERDGQDERGYGRRWRDSEDHGYGGRWEDQRGYGARRWRDEDRGYGDGYGQGRRWRDEEPSYEPRWRDDYPRRRWEN